MGRGEYRIVLVEDAEPDVFLVKQALEQSGLKFHLQVLDDGEKGVNYVESLERDADAERPDLFLMDLNLPKKSGSQILARLRQSESCGEIPVVILTSSDSRRDRDQAAELKATGYFRKPSRLDEFMKLGPYVRNLLTHPGS